MSADDAEFPPEASKVRPIRAVLESKPPAPFPVTWISDAVLNLDAQPVVKGIIERGSFVMVYTKAPAATRRYSQPPILCCASWTGARPWTRSATAWPLFAEVSA